MSLHPDYPVVTGDYQMTKEWATFLPEKFSRRIEEGDLVLWRPALTFWICAWGNDDNTSIEDRLKDTIEFASGNRIDEQIERTEQLTRLTYELPEEDDERPKPNYTSISGYVFSQAAYLQITAYFDTPAARDLGYEIIHSVRNVA